MRSERYKQVACISETNAHAFEQKTNAILAGIINPEIILDKVKPFTAYIFYNIRKDVPETVLELLEMLDTDGGRATCEKCPHFVRSTDRRRKWHTCDHDGQPTRADSRACEVYYMEKHKLYTEAIEQYKNIPYEIE